MYWYWLAKLCIANKQVNSKLLKHLGCEVKAFQHRSPGSEREIIQLTAQVIQDDIVDQVKSWTTRCMWEVKNKWFFSFSIAAGKRKKRKQSSSRWKVYSNRGKAAVPMLQHCFKCFVAKLKELGLDVTKVNGMASDGAPLGCSCVTFAFPHALFFLPPAQFLAASRLSSGLPHKSSSLLRPDLCLVWSLVTFAFPRARFLLPPAQFLAASMVSFSLLLEST